MTTARTLVTLPPTARVVPGPLAHAQPRRVAEFHWLRSIACLGVVAIHALTLARGYFPWRDYWTAFGVVQMLLMFSTPAFVFLSAAQVAYSYDRPPVGFLRKRVRYILVPYVLVNIGYAAFEALIAWRKHGDGSALIAEWGYRSAANLAGGSHLWFIIPIFQFYVVYALLGRWLRPKRWTWLLLAAFVVNIAYLAVFNFSPPVTGAYTDLVGRHWFSFFLPAWIFYFVAGLWAGSGYDRFKGLIQRNLPSLMLGLVLTTVAVLALHYSHLLHDVSSRRFDVLVYTSFMIAALLAVGSRRTMIPHWLTRVSQHSFGIYLLHPFFLALMGRGLVEQLTRLPALVGVLGLVLWGVVAAYMATGLLARLPGGSLIVGRVRQA